MESIGKLANLQGHLPVQEQPTPACRKQQWATQELGKAEAYLEFRLAMDVQGRIKAIYKYIDNKRKAKENVDPLCNPVTKDMEKAGAFNPFFASIFTGKLWP